MIPHYRFSNLHISIWHILFCWNWKKKRLKTVCRYGFILFAISQGIFTAHLYCKFLALKKILQVSFFFLEYIASFFFHQEKKHKLMRSKLCIVHWNYYLWIGIIYLNFFYLNFRLIKIIYQKHMGSVWVDRLDPFKLVYFKLSIIWVVKLIT